MKNTTRPQIKILNIYQSIALHFTDVEALDCLIEFTPPLIGYTSREERMTLEG